MNILLDELPQEIEVCGKKYPINTDFRVWIGFEEMLFTGCTAKAITNIILSCIKKEGILKMDLPPSLKETLKALCNFYFCREEVKEEKTSCVRTKRIYSFTHDAELIYSAFLQQYGIDLTKCNMHWWKFRALFMGLSGELKICSVMKIRSLSLSDMPSGSARNKLAKLKRIYALPDFRSGEERETELAEALW